MKKAKNKITTNGYFLRRLRDSGFIAVRSFSKFGQHDPRKWSVIVDPGVTSVIITCYQNKENAGDVFFTFDDGEVKFPHNWKLKTQSMEVIVTTLIERDIPQKENDSIFLKED